MLHGNPAPPAAPFARLRTGAPALAVAAFLSATLAGCGPAGPEGLAVYTASLPLEGPCPTTSVSTTEFASEIAELRARITGSGMEAVTSSAAIGDPLEVESVPAGEDRTVALYGVASSGAEPWRGITRGITVTEGESVNVNVLLTRVADLTCPRTPQSDARAFHTATKLDDGRILIVGGASAERDASATCAGCTTMSATSAVDVYDPTTGEFTPVGGLTIRRMLHTATKLEDGRVVIIGGTEEARLDPSLSFPLTPTLFVSLVEVFDPTDNSIRSAGDPVGGGRVFHQATALPGGTLLVTGGIETVNATNDLSNALDTTLFCSGSQIVCGVGPSMTRRRAGHTAAFIERPDGISELTLWGGSVGPDTDGPAYQLEAMQNLQAGFALKDVAAMAASRNLFFAATAQYSPFRVLSAGGLERAPDGTFSMAIAQEGPGGPVFVYDASAVQGGGGIATRHPQGRTMALAAPSFFGSAAGLPGEDRAIIAGGFNGLDFAPTNALDFFNETDLTVAPLSVGGAPRTLRQARGALVAAPIGNGTVLMSGGTAGDAGLRIPLPTSEIFTDSLDPTQ